jgi:hypothetical protein
MWWCTRVDTGGGGHVWTRAVARVRWHMREDAGGGVDADTVGDVRVWMWAVVRAVGSERPMLTMRLESVSAA